MKKLFLIIPIFILIFVSGQQTLEISVNGLKRNAIIFPPKEITNKTPVLFVYHGHGGNANLASRKMNFQEYYPEALVVFMQGIPGTRGIKTDPEGLLNGWQLFPNDQNGRDLEFFDEMLKTIRKKYNIEAQKIFVAGHSNGARFANVLWATRSSDLKGIISVSAQGGRMIQGASPISVWMCMGTKDPIVPFEDQEKSIPVVKENLGISNQPGKKIDDDKILYNGIQNTKLMVEERQGGHEFPREDLPAMVEFMKSL